MPSRDTVRRGQSENDPFRDRYAIVRDQKADVLAEEAIHIARNADADTDTVTVCWHQIDTIKWLTAKIAPRRYGEKVMIDAAAAKVSIGDAIEKGGSGCCGCRRLRRADSLRAILCLSFHALRKSEFGYCKCSSLRAVARIQNGT